MTKIFPTLLLFLSSIIVNATDYHVGPTQNLTTIAEVPWLTLEPGDRVYIHWKDTPYFEKWVINRQGTADNRIEIIGVSGPNGEQPVISGNGAVTPEYLDYWNEVRGVIKIGGSSAPADGLPSYITIENLEIRSAYVDYQFTDDGGNTDTYVENAAAIYVEKAAHLIIRNCTLHDSGNGIFIGSSGGMTEDILIEKNHIYGNGIIGSGFEHNTYTSAIDITYQYNHFGPLRPGADGNNLKDRSAGLVVRNNWIEDGNRQLDLVDAGSPELIDHWMYNSTYVYGNILVEHDGEGNSQIMHYGGDSGNLDQYRKGNLYFYNNTVISMREGFVTLLRLSSSEESALVFNNVIFTVGNGSNFAMINDAGTFDMNNNWLKEGWVNCHCSPTGTINDYGNTTGTDPLFEDFANQEYKQLEGSPLINEGTVLPTFMFPDNDILKEYVKHQESTDRLVSGNTDIGAYESVGNTDNINYLALPSSQLIVFPNPVKNELNFILPKNNILNYQIFNHLGQVIETKELIKNNQIDVSEFAFGVYYIKIYTTSEVLITKFIKE